MSNQFLLIAIGVILLGMSSCSKSGEKITYTDNSPVINVQVNTLKEGSSGQVLSASGKIEAADNARISTRMMGYIERINVEQGDMVRKGQLLVRINSSDLLAQQAQIDAGILEAKANLNNIEKDLNRYKRLYENKSATDKELDDIQAHYEMAKARLESVKQKRNELDVQFSYTNIKAPISGIVSARMANEGDLANPGMPILEIESHKDLEVVAMVPESEIGTIEMNLPVTVQVPAANEKLNAKVTEIAPSAKYTGGQYQVKASLDSKSELLKPGMYATVDFPVQGKRKMGTLMIPRSSLIKKGQLQGVYTISEDNRALLRWLRLGKTYGENIEVLSGLTAGEKYVLSAEGKLVNGSKVNY
ncbi:MAG: efflux RND transporter periplasmic adaptor subunit [Saprospiraceae bacterium]|nr:efflux RND transporter periplasmic adaptor subunit [Saprospiraceae bacterium]